MRTGLTVICEVCGQVLLNGNKNTKYCRTHATLMHERNRTVSFLRSEEYKKLPDKYKWEIAKLALWN